MVNTLLRPATPGQAARIHAAVSPAIMQLVMHQDDPGILQSCSEYLRCLQAVFSCSTVAAP
jgi:hypothetical protein